MSYRLRRLRCWLLGHRYRVMDEIGVGYTGLWECDRCGWVTHHDEWPELHERRSRAA